MFLPGESQGQRSLAGSRPQGRKESDTTERLSEHTLLSNDCDRHHMTDSVKNVYYLVFTYMWDLENKTNKHNKTETDSQRGGCQRGGMKGDEWKRWGRLRGTCWRYEMSAAGPSPRAPDQQRSYWVRPHSRRWVAGKTETTPLHTCSPQPGLWKKYLHKTSSGAKMVGNHWYTT